MKYSQYNNTTHVFYYRKLSAGSNNLCFHTKATNWVEGENVSSGTHGMCWDQERKIIKFCLFYV